jgi:hypothetical protein
MIVTFIGLVVFIFGFFLLCTVDYENLGYPMSLMIVGAVVFGVGFLSILFT